MGTNRCFRLFADAVAANKQLGTLSFPLIDIRHYLVELCSIDLRPLLGVCIEGIAYRAPAGASDALFNELIIAFLFHVQA